MFADVSISKIKKAKSIIMDRMYNCTRGEYSRVFDYQLELMRSNPGSTVIVKLDTDEPEPTFQRFYVCLDALKKGFKAGCRRVVGLDGCFFKGAGARTAGARRRAAAGSGSSTRRAPAGSTESAAPPRAGGPRCRPAGRTGGPTAPAGPPATAPPAAPRPDPSMPCAARPKLGSSRLVESPRLDTLQLELEARM